MYNILELAKMSGISTRTLRHYDQIGLLIPEKRTDANYRIYTSKDVDTLQQILLYKELGFELKEIKTILSEKEFSQIESFRYHLDKLKKQKKHYDHLITQVEVSIQSLEGKRKMSDNEKFNYLKKEMIEKNDQQYGREVEERWGKEVYKKSKQKVANMTKADLDRANHLQTEIIKYLTEGFALSDPSSEPAQIACAMHKEWLMYFWPSYSKEAHLGLVDMYLQDERFKVHYDQHQEGLALFLNKAMHLFLSEKKS